MRPKSATTSAARRSVDDASATSTSYARARPPADSIVATVSAAAERSMSATATDAPSCANSTADARPMPEPAPVMRQTLSGRRTAAPHVQGPQTIAVQRSPSRSGPRSAGLGYHRSTGRARYAPINAPRNDMTMTIRRPPDVADSSPGHRARFHDMSRRHHGRPREHSRPYDGARPATGLSPNPAVAPDMDAKPAGGSIPRVVTASAAINGGIGPASARPVDRHRRAGSSRVAAAPGKQRSARPRVGTGPIGGCRRRRPPARSPPPRP